MASQSFDTNLGEGIVLFEDQEHKGYSIYLTESTRDIEKATEGKLKGVSAFVVTGGSWSLLTGKDLTGIELDIGNKSEFGPGIYSFKTDPLGDNYARSVRKN